MSEERRLEVLRAIVSEYVHTREPVGSKAIASGHDLGVSSATIRNDMAVLEDAGLIYQPHTSAGRVPTDKGYRFFVDRLTALKPMSPPERRAVEAFLADSVDLDDVVARTVRLLAQVTHQVAVVEYPVTSSALLRRLDVVELAPTRLLVVAITSTGRVTERMVELTREATSEDIALIRGLFTTHCEGLPLNTASTILGELASGHHPALVNGGCDADLRSAICTCAATLVRPDAESRMVVAGLANLARANVDFRDITPVLDALEEQVALLRLFEELDPADAVHVTIGTENSHDCLVETSVVAGTYGSDDGPRAHLGIVGPTRMDYPHTMATVRAVASYLSRYLTR